MQHLSLPIVGKRIIYFLGPSMAYIWYFVFTPSALADSLEQTMNKLLLLRHKQIGTRSKGNFLFACLFFVA